MWVSEVKTKIKRERGNFCHRKTFETLEEGLEGARELAMLIVSGTAWSDEEIMMNHFEIKG